MLLPCFEDFTLEGAAEKDAFFFNRRDLSNILRLPL